MKFTLVISAVVALALSASAAAHVLLGFNSPTGNIKCYYNPHGLTSRGFTPGVRCGLDHADYTMKLQRICKAGDWHGFTLTPKGRPLLYCPGGASGDRVKYKTLAYGKSQAAGPVHLHLPHRRRHVPQPHRARAVPFPPGLPHLVNSTFAWASVRECHPSGVSSRLALMSIRRH